MERHCRLRSLFGSCNGEPDRDNRNLSTSGSTSGSFHDEAFNGTAGYAGEAARDGDFYGEHPLLSLKPVCTAEQIAQMREAARKVTIHPCIREYIVQIVEETGKIRAS